MTVNTETHRYFARLRGSGYAITFKAPSRKQAIEIAASKFELPINTSYIILSSTPAKGICYQEN